MEIIENKPSNVNQDESPEPPVQAAPEVTIAIDTGKTGKPKREKRMYLKDSLQVAYLTDKPLIEHMLNQAVSIPLGMAY